MIKKGECIQRIHIQAQNIEEHDLMKSYKIAEKPFNSYKKDFEHFMLWRLNNPDKILKS